MSCLKCKSKIFMNGFCRKHFIENIERRVKKEVRQKGLIKRNENLIVRDALSRHFISNVLNMPVKTGKKGREVVLWTMDDEILNYLRAMFSRKKQKKLPKSKIKLFRAVKDSELEAYARLKKLRFNKKRTEDEKTILKEIDRFDQKHRETRFSLLKSIEELTGL